MALARLAQGLFFWSILVFQGTSSVTSLAVIHLDRVTFTDLCLNPVFPSPSLAFGVLNPKHLGWHFQVMSLVVGSMRSYPSVYFCLQDRMCHLVEQMATADMDIPRI